MSGYRDDFSMSNNAFEAYLDGRAPLSGWTKDKLFSALLSEGGSAGARLHAVALKNKLPLAFLRAELLECRGEWHHTSKFYNITYFYMLRDETELEEITEKELCEKFAEWKAGHKAQLAERKARKANSAQFGKLVFDLWVGTRNFGRYKTFERSGWVRREANWLVVYAEKECKTILTRRLEGSNSCPRFVAAGDDNNNK